MIIILEKYLFAIVFSMIETGKYNNRSEVIRAALRHMEDQEQRAATLETMRRSLEDVRDGRTRKAKPAIAKIAEELGLNLER